MKLGLTQGSGRLGCFIDRGLFCDVAMLFLPPRMRDLITRATNGLTLEILLQEC